MQGENGLTVQPRELEERMGQAKAAQFVLAANALGVAHPPHCIEGQPKVAS